MSLESQGMAVPMPNTPPPATDRQPEVVTQNVDEQTEHVEAGPPTAEPAAVEPVAAAADVTMTTPTVDQEHDRRHGETLPETEPRHDQQPDKEVAKETPTMENEAAARPDEPMEQATAKTDEEQPLTPRKEEQGNK